MIKTGTFVDPALEYYARGWPVIPVDADKRPLCEWGRWRFQGQTEAEVLDLFSRPAHGMALLTWPASELVVLDFDGCHAHEVWQTTGIILPSTAQTRTRSGGTHLIFRFPDGTPQPGQAAVDQTFQRKVRLAVDRNCGCAKPCGVDLLLNGYFIVPPTPGYREDPDHPLEPGRLATIPPEVLSLARAGAKSTANPVPDASGNDWFAWALHGPIPEGQRNDTATRIAGALLAKSLPPDHVYLLLVPWARMICVPPMDLGELQITVRSIARKEATKAKKKGTSSPLTLWEAARSALDFVNSAEAEPEWLEYPLLAPGSITEIFSPRGIGKTHVAHALGVKLARRGKRVLLLDRDNSPREVKQRLRGWGAGTAEAATLKVMTRDKAPPLTDAAAWASFPFQEYDLVIIDSLDATTEGVGEKDSAKPSRALAPILDLARRAEGPAILVLGNTVKSAEHGRGSGVIEDRADICFEGRDATGLLPTGRKPWWLELPPAGAWAWAERATRRKRRSRYRLAFVPSKFRVGEEPDPFILEIDLSAEPWTLRDVTAEVIQAGEAARAQAEQERQKRLDEATQALSKAIEARSQVGDPMLADKEAVPFLRDHGLTRAEARQLLKGRDGQEWRIETRKDRQGHPKILLPPEPIGSQSKAPAAENALSQTPQSTMAGEPPFSADRMETARRKTSPTEAAPDAEIRDPRFFPPKVSESPPEPLEVVDPWAM
ncbi:MAG: bifunctional DNA primase/polymerase [candidate division NC10 bacterium]|nr:bifunctional DNA primase/polymerase [candidate division NC10 bacterium]